VHYFRAVVAIRTARPGELDRLPELERASDTLFLSLEIGPLPPPDTVETLRAARVVLVAGDPPLGFVRVDDVDGEAHLEQLAVRPDHGRQGIGRALVQAACRWAAQAGYGEITLATYRDVPWNGPFYASAGFVERGSVEAWCTERGRPPEQPVMARFGTRVIMSRPL
jgi:GNAT superfamily N-acetyltransferase